MALEKGEKGVKKGVSPIILVFSKHWKNLPHFFQTLENVPTPSMNSGQAVKIFFYASISYMISDIKLPLFGRLQAKIYLISYGGVWGET